MNSIEKLVKIFSEFPGIGPKQAKRFVYFLIRKPESYIEEFKKEISLLKSEIEICSECKRYFAKNGAGKKICNICSDTSREDTILMIVGRDVDLDNVERNHNFLGKYFVLGGLVPVLDKLPEQRIRLNDLIKLIEAKSKKGLQEIILGLDANSDGEYTAEIIKNAIFPIVEKNKIKVSELGRGLSTGTELEYSDPETIKYALKNRS